MSTQKKKKSVSRVETLCDFMDCNPPGSSVHGIFRQEYWSGLPFPSPGDLPDPGIEPRSPALEVDSLLSEPPGNITFSVSNLRLNIPTPVFLPGKSYAQRNLEGYSS